jgi:hypothetical protein
VPIYGSWPATFAVAHSSHTDNSMDERLLVWQLEGPIDRQVTDRVTALLHSKVTMARAAATSPQPDREPDARGAADGQDVP